ncbi:MAG: branched-chain amino acid transporter permease [Oscillospiraceae bacterium]
MNLAHSLALVAVMVVVNALSRFLPFWVFSKGVPKPVVYLGKVLPPAIMAMLVVYCLRNMTFLEAPYGAAEVIAVAVVVLIHKWRHSTMLSLIGGTACYMLLVQVVFA